MGKGITMNVLTHLHLFLRDERGMETVEWAVLAALVTAALVAAIKTLGTSVKNAFTSLSTAA
jgi:Flp pilus assembly pilin Flp